MKTVNKQITGRQPGEREKEIRRFLEKIVINAGVGRLSQQPNFSGTEGGKENKKSVLSQITRDIALIAGQAPQTKAARKSIAGFKTRQGQIIGLMATMRRRKMVDFFEKLIKIILPRVRDFRGLELKSVDEGGVLNIGFREQLTFPEINPEEAQIVFSLGVNLVPRKKNRDEAIEMYRRLGVPLKK